MEEEEDLERVQYEQRLLQVRREVRVVLGSSGIVLKTKQARLKAEELSRDFNELGKILEKGYKGTPPNEVGMRWALAEGRNRFREANKNAKEALDFGVGAYNTLCEILSDPKT